MRATYSGPDLEIGKIKAGEYLIEGYEVYRQWDGAWITVSVKGVTRGHDTLVAAKYYIADVLYGGGAE
jgi:hypothetical protein